MQNGLRQTASIERFIHYGVLVKDKQKGKKHDLTVTEYKVQQESKRLGMVTENLDEKQDMLYDTSLRLEQAEKEVSEAERHLSDTKTEIAGAAEDLIQIKTESWETKQKLLAEQEEIKQENLSLKIDTLTLHSDKECFLRDVRKAADEKEQMQVKKEGLLEDIGVLDRELEKRLDFINVLDKLKVILYKLLSMIPIVREFARLVGVRLSCIIWCFNGQTGMYGVIVRNVRFKLMHMTELIFTDKKKSDRIVPEYVCKKLWDNTPVQ